MLWLLWLIWQFMLSTWQFILLTWLFSYFPYWVILLRIKIFNFWRGAMNKIFQFLLLKKLKKIKKINSHLVMWPARKSREQHGSHVTAPSDLGYAGVVVLERLLYYYTIWLIQENWTFDSCMVWTTWDYLIQSTLVYSHTVLAQCKFWKSGDYRQREL
jgi:hypothetical protein